MQAQLALGTWDEDGATLGRADAALEVGAASLEAGAPGPQVRQLPGVAFDRMDARFAAAACRAYTTHVTARNPTSHAAIQ